MKKKFFVLIFLFLFFGLVTISDNVRGIDYYIVYYLETDKEVYFIEDKILINASWYLNYDSGEEISGFSIKIFNTFNDMIWTSPIYNEIGNFTKGFTVNIQDLNISFTNYSNVLFVKLFYEWFNYNLMKGWSSFLDTIEIKTIKREASCNLLNFTEYLIYGENLQFKAKFYDKLSGYTTRLINQTISFKISSNNLITYENNFTINSFGIVEVNISSFPYLSLGPNTLILTLNNSKFYNTTSFFYITIVEKIPIFIEIVNFNNTLGKQENLKIKAFYHYYFNYVLKPLNDYGIQLKIYSKSALKYQNMYKTNSSGILLIDVPYKLLNITQNDDKLIINLIFNGTDYLEKKEIVLYVEINQISSSKIDPSLRLLTFSIVPVLAVLMTLLSLISYNNKNLKQISLKEITFKY